MNRYLSWIGDYILKHPQTWYEDLQKPPYSLSIKTSEGMEGLYLFRYHQIDSDFSLPIVREARGIILQVYEGGTQVVCRAFNKFFNLGEKHAPKATELVPPLRAEPKIDGSIIKLWYWDRDNKWMVSTNGTINAFNTELPCTDTGKTFGDLVFGLLEENFQDVQRDFFEHLNTHYTYVFELVGPHNRVVVPYSEDSLYFLTSFNNRTWEEYGPRILHQTFFTRGWTKIRSIVEDSRSLNSIEEVYRAIEDINDLYHEGFVVVDAIGKRVKVKTPRYVELHRLRGEHNPTSKRFVSLILSGEDGEFLSYFPEYTPQVERIRGAMGRYMERVAPLLLEFSHNEFENRKAAALWIQDLVPDTSRHLFYKRIGLPKSRLTFIQTIGIVRSYLRTIKPEQVLQVIGYEGT